MFRIDAGRYHALVGQGLGRAYQTVAGHDDAVVGGDEVLLGAVDDRPHAFLQRGVLDGDAFDAAVVAAGLLRGAVHEVVVILVRHRDEVGARDGGRMDALARLHRVAFGRGERPRDVIVEAPRPAILVVDRDPE